MQHEITIMAETLQKCSEDYMWYYVDSGASNHMTRHTNWFESLREPKISSYVQTSDTTTHTTRRGIHLVRSTMGFRRRISTTSIVRCLDGPA